MNNTHQQWAQDMYDKLQIKLLAQCKRVGSNIPYIPRDGRYKDLDTPTGIFWWTNGFWPGMLWQMYNATKELCYKEAAEAIEVRFDDAIAGFMGLHHDVGFQWLHTAVANYRLTGNEQSRVRGLHVASLLAGRYNPAGKFIRAWNLDRTGWVIVDTMMNLPLLYWASEQLNDPRFSYIAQNHADTCQALTIRGDGSSNHIIALDPTDGSLVDIPPGQGFAPESSWTRGMAWAIYGFALSYRYTGRTEYLDTAKRIAHYFIANLAQSDWLPLIDFRAPAQPVKYDSTASMCAACGMMEIAHHVNEHEKALYTESAMKTLMACEKAFANWNPEEDGIIGNGAASYHTEKYDKQANIIYGDYFFVEAVMRVLGKDFLIW